MSDARKAFDKWAKRQLRRPSTEVNLTFGAGFKAGFAAGEAKNKSALDLMRSLSINPTIPEGLRIMMKESLHRG